MASLLVKPTVQQPTATARPLEAGWAWWLSRLVVDGALINAAFYVAYYLRYVIQPVQDESWRAFEEFDVTRLMLTVFILATLQFKGVYRLARSTSLLDEAGRVASSATIGYAVTIVAGVALRIPAESRLALVYSWAFTIGLLVLWRAAIRTLRYTLWQRGIGIDRVVVIGEGESARRVMQALAEQPHLGYRLIGFIGLSLARAEWTIATQHRVVRAPCLGLPADLTEVVRRLGIHEVFIALPPAHHEQVMELVGACRARGVRFKIVPDLFELSLDQMQVDELNGVPLLGVKSSAISGWNFVLKRGIDIVLATLALGIGSPLFGLIALLIKLDSPGPIIFRQVRVGKNGRHFICYKFRSMYEDAEHRLEALREMSDADGPLFKMRDDPRRTRVGTFLRRTSLDELPQIYNILKGDMSWVGPRPGVPAEVELYEDWHRARLGVTPGLTGLWQVSGRSDLTFDEMVLLDLYYAEHWSVWLDLKIMLRTVPAVLLARGAY